MPTAAFAPPPAAWDAFVRASPRPHVLQTAAWAQLKGAYGWRSACVALPDAAAPHGICAGAQVLFRPLPLRLGTLAYVAMGPLYAASHVGDAAVEAALWSAIDRVAKQHRAALLLWEPGFVPDAAAFAARAHALGFRPSASTVQPPRTILIDLADDETLLARMNQGTRRKIRQSQKQDVRYWHATRDDVPRFTAMMQATGARNAFGVHEPAYYALAYELFVPHDAALILAEHEGDLLAGILVFALGPTAWYLYGASSSSKRNLMATYGVQWEAMRWARARGCTVYDLWGIPDADEAVLEAQFEARSDGLWGVYGFKRGFGGRIARTAGAWDKPYNPLLYAAYHTMQAWRARRAPPAADTRTILSGANTTDTKDEHA